MHDERGARDALEHRRAFVAQLASFAPRYPELTRARENVDARPSVTGAYVDLVLAWGFAKLGEEERATRLRDVALHQLNLEDAVDGYLAGALAVRIDQALAGLPAHAPLPLALGRGLARLPRYERYTVDLARSHLRVLEPLEVVEPNMPFESELDNLGGEFAVCRTLDDVPLREELEQLTARALDPSTVRDARDQLTRGVLCFLPRLALAEAMALLERIVAAIDDAGDDAALLALDVAARFRRSDLVERIFDRVYLILAEAHRDDAFTRVLQTSLPSVRDLAHRDCIRDVVNVAYRVGSDHDVDALVVRALLAGAYAYLGDAAGAADDWWTAEHPGVDGIMAWTRVPAAERASLQRAIDDMVLRGRPASLGDVRVFESRQTRHACLLQGRRMLREVEEMLDAALRNPPQRGRAAARAREMRRRLSDVTRAVALAGSFLPSREALAVFDRVFERLRFLSDRVDANTRMCLPVVAYIDALVVPLVARALAGSTA